jgi:hypothetical protein
MITLNPVKLTTIKPITFGQNNNNSRAGLMALDKNYDNKINFEKDLFITQNADTVQTKNPLKAIGYNIVKAYNILTTPNRTIENENYIHLPYMA